MYASDTTLVSHLENFVATNIEIEREINQEISKVNTWLLSNKLVLNESKSKFMLFFKHPQDVPTLKLLINGNLVELLVTNFIFYVHVLPLTKTLHGVIIIPTFL